MCGSEGMFMRRDQGDIYFSGSFPTLSEPLASLGGDRCPCWLRIHVVRAQLVGFNSRPPGKIASLRAFTAYEMH